MRFEIGAALLVGGMLGCASLWPSPASAQCSPAAPDQTCQNSGSISGPLQSQGLAGSDGSAGGPGSAGGAATTINSGTISPSGASATGGAGGQGDTSARGGDGGAAALANTGTIGASAIASGGNAGASGDGGIEGGHGGNGGAATATNSSGIAGGLTVMGGNGAVGGFGSVYGGVGGNGGIATLANSGSIGGAATVIGGYAGGGGDSDVSGFEGGFGSDGGSAVLTNAGTIGTTATVQGGEGGGGGYGLVSGGVGGDGGSATLVNSGSIGGAAVVQGGRGGGGGPADYGSGGSGGNGGDATLLNSGTIAASATVTGGRGGSGQDGSGDDGGWGGSGGNATLVNSGNIGGAVHVAGGNGGSSGKTEGLDTPVGGNGGAATLTNTGLIGGAAVVTAGNGGADGGGGMGGNGGNATLNNWGRIFGGVSVTAGAGGTGNLGGVAGSDGVATLNVYAGSQIAGAIALNGSTKALNFFGGNYSYTLNSLAGVNITANGAPFVVIGNTVVVVDPQMSATIQSAATRALLDFTRIASDAVPVFSGPAAGGGAALAFASSDAPSRFDDAFAAVSGPASAYAGDAVVFKAPTATYADGTSVWARGFAGQRVQQQDGTLPRNTNLFYGGLMGVDVAAHPDLHYGLYLGGGTAKTAIDLTGGSNADLVFGGAYARYEIGPSFLYAGLQAGVSRNSVSRTVNNNLAPGGLETASGAFNGWYVSPEATFGHRWALGNVGGAAYTLTPSLRLRYLHGAYDGYTETGTAAPLTVGSQTVSALEERSEMKLTRSVSFTPADVLSTSITAGVLGMQRRGGNTVNAALLGQAIPFAPTAQSNVWGGFGGVGLEWRSLNVTLFSAAEYLTLSDKSNVVSGRAGLRVSF